MDKIIDEIIKIVKKNCVKYITISESNHRSYTSHTFHSKLVKRLHKERIIDTFSSERMGVFDELIINYYVHNKLDLNELKENLIFGGLGIKRWLKYFQTQDPKSFQIIGFESDEYPTYIFDRIPRHILEHFFSPNFIEDILNGKDVKKIRTKLEEDKRVKESFVRMLTFMQQRETHWLSNIKKALKYRTSLFINGYHLSKKDIIGKHLKEKYGKQCLILGMSAYDIKTQKLFIDGKKYPTNKAFSDAIHIDDYIQKDEKVNDLAPPTKYEKYLHQKYKDWKLIKVNKQNGRKKIRAIGCYLGITQEDFEKGVKMNDVVDIEVKNYDYIVFFNKSVYKENMFE